MYVFSLIMDDDTHGERCLGIYTTFDKCYQMLKEDIDDKYFTYYDNDEIKRFYSVYEISLDNEIAECGDFTTDGKEIEIDWDKLFKEIEDEHNLNDIETRALAIELSKRLTTLRRDENQTDDDREIFARVGNLMSVVISALAK